MEKVLIVEDSKVFARMLIRKIEDELFFDTCWASNFEEARYILEENPDNDTFFVALLDLHLPDAADGRIVAIEPAHDPWRDCDALKISVFMNVFNVHSNRSPVDGTVLARWYHPGKFLNAALDKASCENERNALHLRSDTGHELTCVQVAGLVARRILCYVEPGDRLTRGQRYGFIRFGSRVDLYLPPDSRPRVVFGEKVKATSTILAEFPAAEREAAR